jgi:hypothetical protein
VKGGSQEIVKPMAITQLKVEDAYNLCNVIKKNLTKQSDQGRKMRAFCPLQVQKALA